MNFCQTYQFADGQCRHWQIGPLSLYLKTGDRELMLGVERQEDEYLPLVWAEPVEEPPASLEWQRWAMADATPTISFHPAFPASALVVRPESPLTIPPGVECLFYTLVPLDVEIRLAAQAPVTLASIPSVVLSKTWFGEDTINGEFCLAMRTTARRRLDGLPTRQHRAICPVLVCNDSDQPIDCVRLCLRVAHLSLYRDGDQFWTSQVVLHHRDKLAGEHLEYVEKRPDGGALGEEVIPPREAIRGGLWLHSIGTIGLGNWFRSA